MEEPAMPEQEEDKAASKRKTLMVVLFISSLILVAIVLVVSVRADADYLNPVIVTTLKDEWVLGRTYEVQVDTVTKFTEATLTVSDVYSEGFSPDHIIKQESKMILYSVVVPKELPVGQYFLNANVVMDGRRYYGFARVEIVRGFWGSIKHWMSIIIGGN